MSISKRKVNIVWLHKWSLIKEKRQEMERICNNIRQVKNRKKTYFQGIKAFKIIREMF